MDRETRVTNRRIRTLAVAGGSLAVLLVGAGIASHNTGVAPGTTPVVASTPSLTVAPTLAPTLTPVAEVTPESTMPADLQYTAICNDGTGSFSVGSGTCSHHGGINHYTSN